MVHKIIFVERVMFLYVNYFQGCKNCDGTGCLECNPAYYLIDSVCYARYELTLT